MRYIINVPEKLTKSKSLIKRFKKDLKALKKSDLAKEDSFELNSVILIAGFIRDTNFIARANALFGKNENHCKVNVGEALAVMLLMLASGRYQSMSKCAVTILDMPLVNLLDLDPSIEPSDFSRYVMGRALAIFAQGGQQFFHEFAIDVYQQYGLTDVIEVHVDSTSMYFYKLDDKGDEVPMTPEEVDELKANMPLDEFNAAVAASRSELEKAQQELDANALADAASKAEDAQLTGKKHKTIKILRGHSKDHRPDLGQIVICSIVEGTHGISLFTKITDGNSSDRSLFATVAIESLTVLTERFKNLKYWVSDSAGCTKDSFDAVTEHGVAIVTRATDNLLFTKEIIKQVQDNPKLLQDFLDESGQWQYTLKNGVDAGLPKAFMCKGELFNRDVVALLISNPTLAKTKKHSEQKKAEAEYAKLTKGLNKRYKCQADADTHAKKLIAKAKYCNIELLGHDGKEVNAKHGPQPKDPAKRQTKLVDVKVLAKVTISQTKLKEAIEQECLYVIVTTDTEREWIPVELYNVYKRNSHIETLWRVQKNSSQFLNRFFLQNNDRIEGLAILLSIGAFAHTVMQTILRREVDQGNLQIPDDEGKAYDPKPTMNRICDYFNRHPVKLLFKLKPSGKIKIKVTRLDELVFSVLVFLGESWCALFRAKTYKGAFARKLLRLE